MLRWKMMKIKKSLLVWNVKACNTRPSSMSCACVHVRIPTKGVSAIRSGETCVRSRCRRGIGKENCVNVWVRRVRKPQVHFPSNPTAVNLRQSFSPAFGQAAPSGSVCRHFTSFYCPRTARTHNAPLSHALFLSSTPAPRTSVFSFSTGQPLTNL